MSVLLYTNLFTVRGTLVSLNKYIDMFHIWLTYVARNACLTAADRILVFIDAETLGHIRAVCPLIVKMLNTMPCKIDLVTVGQEVNLFRGMIAKYSLFNGEWSTNYDKIIYTDVDVMILHDLHDVKMPAPDTLYVAAEGAINDEAYLGHLAYPEEMSFATGKVPGATGSIFGLRPGANTKAFFKEMCDTLTNNLNDPDLLTVEQPYFNRTIVRGIIHDILVVSYDLTGSVKRWDDDNRTTASHIFLNFSGASRAPYVHLQKMIQSMHSELSAFHTHADA